MREFAEAAELFKTVLNCLSEVVLGTNLGGFINFCKYSAVTTISCVAPEDIVDKPASALLADGSEMELLYPFARNQ